MVVWERGWNFKWGREHIDWNIAVDHKSMKDQQFPKEIHKNAVLSIVYNVANLQYAFNVLGKTRKHKIKYCQV